MSDPQSADGHHQGQHRDDDEALAHLGLRRRESESRPGRDQYRHGDPDDHDQQRVQRVLTEGDDVDREGVVRPGSYEGPTRSRPGGKTRSPQRARDHEEERRGEKDRHRRDREPPRQLPFVHEGKVSECLRRFCPLLPGTADRPCSWSARGGPTRPTRSRARPRHRP
jgi:hypothetical protein